MQIFIQLDCTVKHTSSIDPSPISCSRGSTTPRAHPFVVPSIIIITIIISHAVDSNNKSVARIFLQVVVCSILSLLCL